MSPRSGERDDKVVTIIKQGVCIVILGCLAGCAHLRLSPPESWQEAGAGIGPPTTGADMRWLLALDPGVALVGSEAEAWALELERRYVRDVEVCGVVWQPMRSATHVAEPDSYGTGGDSMLFTGTALAGWAWKYGTTRAEADRERVLEGLRGMWWLTHAAGPGVLCRNVFPRAREAEFGWPSQWGGRVAEGFVGESGPVEDPVRGRVLPASRWYTRATRDQLSGLVLGLAAVLRVGVLDEPDSAFAARTREVVGLLVTDVLAQLKAHDWKIRDARGENDTSADAVDGLLKLGLIGVAWRAGVVSEAEYVAEFEDWSGSVFGFENELNRFANLMQYYAHNLRVHRSMAVWLLEGDAGRRFSLVEYARDNWRKRTVGHVNGWFSLVWATMSGDESAKLEGDLALAQLQQKPTRLWTSPLAGAWPEPGLLAVLFDKDPRWVLPVYLRQPSWYWTWQTAPWDAGTQPPDPLGLRESPNIDFLVPYWMGRYYGLLPGP